MGVFSHQKTAKWRIKVNSMKKIFLSLSLIAAFFVYIIFKEFDGEGAIRPVTNSSAGSGTPPPNPSAPVAASAPAPAAAQSAPAPDSVNSGNGRMGMGMMQPQGQYKNGSYVGSVADAYFGNVQVKAVIKNGAIADVQFLQYPNSRSYSIEVNSQAMPYLTQEAIQSQNANVDIISGATQTSLAFIQSLGDALAQAKN
jgi:uncharacterized protein with FMN-binding domain